MNHDGAIAKIVRLHGELYIALCGKDQTKDIVEKDLKCGMVVQFDSISRVNFYEESERGSLSTDRNSGFWPIGLSEIFHFNTMITKTSKLHASYKLVLCAGSDVQAQVQLAFLLGCHMIMTHGLGFEEAYLAFRPLFTLFESILSDEMSVEKSLRAFCCAKCLNWIDFGQHIDKSQSDHPICMDEFDHYARFF